MRYTGLGKTGLQVSSLSYGASALGGMYGAVDEQDAIRSVHTALDGGVNLLDVAPFYGLTRAEAVLGKALRNRPRDSYILATKAGRNGWDAFDFSARALVRSVEASLKRLGVEYLDIVQLHDVEYHGRRYLRQALEEGIPALQQLKAAGSIRCYGVTAYPVALLGELLLEIELDTVLCHNHYTLADTQLLELVPVAARRQVGLIAASPLGTGLLTGHGAADWHPASAADRAVVRRAAQFCHSQGTTIERLALQFGTAEPSIPTMLVSCAGSERMRQNLAAVEQPLDWDMVEQVRAMLAPLRDRDWTFGG